MPSVSAAWATTDTEVGSFKIVPSCGKSIHACGIYCVGEQDEKKMGANRMNAAQAKVFQNEQVFTVPPLGNAAVCHTHYVYSNVWGYFTLLIWNVIVKYQFCVLEKQAGKNSSEPVFTNTVTYQEDSGNRSCGFTIVRPIQSRLSNSPKCCLKIR